MKNYGKATILAGLIGMVGADATGYGWFTASALVGCGIALWIQGRKEKHEKEDSSSIINRDIIVQPDKHRKGRPVHRRL